MMNVIIVDEHGLFRTGTRITLKSRFDNVATLETDSIYDLERIMQVNIFDIVIIGLSEEHSKIDRGALKKIMKTHPLVSFIVCGGIPDYKLGRSLMRMGVKGYLTKQGCPEELVACVRAVLAGQSFLNDQVSSPLQD
ncbi:hypothetical protein [Dyadobacter pollutisoli]|uniref:Response regulatory domain-containing protein n=1 Tax=Dyadobacter pollutisoli TaxID=2910158 RepID=A0A9E8NJ95_9BACT|nr:hypothetical protein [Dyadobacter pollutisoli]WAC15039.1 hypothetical protein ON006_13945 [Dyadobacter pollutisoli]